MISNLVNWLIHNGSIKESDKELYIFATRYIILAIIPISLTLIINLIIDNLINCLCIIFTVLSLRKFTGGFHFDSEKICVITSTIALCSITFFSTYLNHSILFDIIMVISCFSIIINSPIIHMNHSVSKNEIKVYKIIILILTLCYLLAYFILCQHYSNYAIDIFLGVLLISLLQTPCIVKKIIRKK